MDTITARLLSELRAAGYSWYRIARLLDVRDQSVTKWKNGRSMADDSAVRACAVLKKSQRETVAILAALAMERAGDEQTRAAWADALKRLGGLAAGVLLALGSGGGPTPPAAHAAGNETASVYYGKSKRRRRTWADALRRAALALLPIAFAGCASVDQFTIPDSAPVDVEIRWHRVDTEAELNAYCDWHRSERLFACAHPQGPLCDVYTLKQTTQSILGHEILQHCYLGLQHPPFLLQSFF